MRVTRSLLKGLHLRPDQRDDGPCPPSPAAAIPTSRRSAGASITATCMSARSRAVSATPGPRQVGVALRVLSRQSAGGMHEWYRCRLRSGPRRLRDRVAGLPLEAHRGGLSGVARSARLDGKEIPSLRSRRVDASGCDLLIRNETSSARSTLCSRAAPHSDPGEQPLRRGWAAPLAPSAGPF
jgi:hypothetical protein